MKPLMWEVMKEVREYMWIDTVQEYLEFLVGKILKQRLSLQHYGTRNWQMRQDIIRNITVLGEEVDLVTMKLDTWSYNQENPYSFIERYQRIISEIMIGLSQLIEIIQDHYKDQLDISWIAGTVVEEILSFVRENNSFLMDVYEEKWYYRRYFVENSSQGFHKFQNHLVKKLFSFNTEYCVFRDLDKEIRSILIEKWLYEER